MKRCRASFGRPATATLVLSATALFAACGPAGGETLTREAFLERGNAICAKGNAEIEAAIPRGDGGAPSEEDQAASFKAIMTTSRRMVDEVAALKPPADLQPEMTSIVADSRLVMDKLEAEGAGALFAAQEDPFAEVNKRLSGIGLNVCGEDPGPQ